MGRRSVINLLTIKRFAVVRLLFFIGLILISHRSISQNYTVQVDYFGMRDGLLRRSVNAAVEDPNGFIWLSFVDGVQRFDGNDFLTWSVANGDSQFAGSGLLGIDKEGWIWVATGLSSKFVFIHHETLEVKSIEERFGQKFPNLIGVDEEEWRMLRPQLIKDPEGRILLYSKAPKTTIYVYEGNGVFSQVVTPISKKTHPSLLAVDDQNNYWIYSRINRHTIHKIDSDGNEVQRISIGGELTFSTTGIIDGRLVFFADNEFGTNVYSISTATGEVFTQLLGPTIHHFADKDGNWWIQNNDYWTVISGSGSDTLFQIANSEDGNNISTQIDNHWQDEDGSIWLTGYTGFWHIYFEESKFKNYQYKPKSSPHFSNSIRGIYADHGSLFASSEYQGILEYDKFGSSAPKLHEGWLDPNVFAGCRPVTGLKNGQKVVGFRNHLTFIDKGSVVQEFIDLDAHPNSQTLNKHIHPDIWTLFEDDDGVIWIGSEHGLWSRDQTNSYQCYILDEDRASTIFHIKPGKEKTLWICTDMGLVQFDKESKKTIGIYGNDQDEKNFLPAHTFYWYYEQNDTSFWLGTDNGLISWNPISGKHAQWTQNEGLSSNFIYSVFEDKNGFLWLSSDDGIIQFDLTDHSIKVFRENAGVSQTEFNRTSGFQDYAGNIFFGGVNGVSWFNPADFSSNKDVSYNVEITDCVIFDGALDKHVNRTANLIETKEIIFNPKDKYLNIRFAVPKRPNHQKLLYAWKLYGSDKEWNYQKENVVQLASIPYGHQKLLIKAQTGEGGWTPTLAIDIHSLKPFYLETWFLILTILTGLSILIGYFLIRLRTQRKRQVHLENEIKAATAKILEDKNLIEQQAEELRGLDAAKSRFFTNVTHELRTPLSLIIGPLSSMVNSAKYNAEDLEKIQLVRNNANTLLKLVNSLLDLSKLESGKLELHEKPISLFSFTRRISSSYESMIEDKGITYVFDYTADQKLNIIIDAEKLETILGNLISNAAKYTDSGTITVRVEDLGNQIEFQVQDTGRGIHPEDVNKVFDRFYQTKVKDAPVEGGTGIGLALSRELSRLLKGKLTVESEFGEGSTFSLRVPRREALGAVPIKEEVALNGSPEQKEKEPLSQDKQTILLVEDNRTLREYLESILSRTFNIIQASNGKKALEKLDAARNLPDLIVSDIMMPEMDGYQLLEHLKGSETYWKVPVIMLTARVATEDKLRALRIGVDDYLLKPFEEEELKIRIENLLKNVSNRQGENEDLSEDPNLPEHELKWLKAIEEYVQEQLSEDVSVMDMAQEFGMSRSTLQRQIKKLTGLTPLNYIREHRLCKAREFIESGQFASVSEVVYAVGFSDPASFSRLFKKRFGKNPSHVVQK